MTRILRVSADERIEEVVLKAGPFAIGRHPRNDLVLKDPRISSFHCRIEMEGERCVLLDLKSRNGTLLNSARIDRATLKPNDAIQLGSTKISYIEAWK
jgi:pSer/pThr/pTyr-binding forkhead associated (FHA) protein